MTAKKSSRRAVTAMLAVSIAVILLSVLAAVNSNHILFFIALAFGLLGALICFSAMRNGAFEGAAAKVGIAYGGGILYVFATLIDRFTFAWCLLIILAGLIGGVVTKSLASDRDRNSPIWFLLGFISAPIASIAAMFLPARRSANALSQGKLPLLAGSKAFSRIEPWLYLAPFLAGLIVFTLYPVVNVIFLSFKEDYSYLTRDFAKWSLENYKFVIGDKVFSQALRNTMVYVVMVVPISTCIAVVVAYLLNQKLKGASIFQTAFFMPMVTSITAVGLAWKLMYNKNFGIINYMLSWFGIDAVNWLDNPDWRVCVMTLVVFGIWNILPFTIILLLSGLQNIDDQYYTAAKIDGAKSGRLFFRITVPLLSPTIFLVCIVNTISSFKVFSELYPLFKGNPGPYKNLYTVVYYIRYAMMTNREYGVAAAGAIILFLFILVFTMIQLYVQKKMRKRMG